MLVAVAPRRPPGARVVARPGPLDLDHVGAEVAEQHRRVGARRARARSRRRSSPARGPAHAAAAHYGRVRTLVISDLHLGASTRADLLRRPELREPLLEAVARRRPAGDPRRRARAARRPAPRRARARRRRCSRSSARALGRDGELLMLAGNHDHGLVAGWIDGRLLTEPPGFLGLEQRIAPRDAGPLAAALAERAAPARVRARLSRRLAARRRVRDPRPLRRPAHDRADVRAPGGRARWRAGSSRCPSDGATPDDYEAALAPLYAWMHALTQR